jgi:hypothetical protein
VRQRNGAADAATDVSDDSAVELRDTYGAEPIIHLLRTLSQRESKLPNTLICI